MLQKLSLPIVFGKMLFFSISFAFLSDKFDL